VDNDRPPPSLDLELLAEAVAERLAARLSADRERLLDRAGLAERLGVAERTVAALVARGELPGPLLHTSGVARWEWSAVLRHLGARQGRRLRRGRGRFARGGKASEGKGTE
jgi:hypothetical protein